MKTQASYGSWVSPLELRDLFERPSPPMYPTSHDGLIYWLEAKPDQGGRVVLMQRENHDDSCITPEGFNIRTRVHEYGGQCFVLSGDSIIFSNFVDNRLYRQRLDSTDPPQPLTPEKNADGTVGMYADLHVVGDGDWLVFVYEKDVADGENINCIAVIRLHNDSSMQSEPQVLVEGHDFFANPVVSPDDKHIAWVQWDHPNMPWDCSQASVTQLHIENDSITTAKPKIIAGGEGCSVCQLSFSSDGDLFFAMDKEPAQVDSDNFWNLYRYDLDKNETTGVTTDAAEYGEAHWIFGQVRYVVINDNELIACSTNENGDALVHINIASGAIDKIDSGYNDFAQFSLSESRESVFMIAGNSENDGAVVELSLADYTFSVVKQLPPILSTDNISSPRTIAYATGDGGQAYAYYYSPRNAQFECANGSLPPLLVFVHGGPTSRTTPAFNATKQYWTTLGFAVLDINHRGSTGHGRVFRQKLLGQWGVIDASDIVDGVQHIIDQGLADKDKIFIRGGSAGGYAVLRVLTEYPDVFRAGACYYGIGNLQTLAEMTHKFEGRYLDGLMGEDYDPANADKPDSPYRQRSPIFFMNKVKSPMILFQGEDDKVVPPAVSREVVATLKQNDVYHEYVEYSGEGHGFRRSETRIDALRRESKFFIELIN